jgi:hypothetical protein
MAAVDVFSTENCPIGFRCEICGDAADGMVPVTAVTPLGILCLTACPRCADSDMAPPVSVGTAVKLVLQHCIHSGITADEMRDALAELTQGGGES